MLEEHASRQAAARRESISRASSQAARKAATWRRNCAPSLALSSRSASSAARLGAAFSKAAEARQ
eukprot:12404378-Alexandrium_andersonii.AAC.1